jgi:hypothetical protein
VVEKWSDGVMSGGVVERWSGGEVEWWSGADPVTTADKTSENARSRLLRHYARHRRSITPPLQFLLVQGGAFVDIALWKANLFLLACLFLSVSSAVPGSPFRRLD